MDVKVSRFEHAKSQRALEDIPSEANSIPTDTLSRFMLHGKMNQGRQRAQQKSRSDLVMNSMNAVSGDGPGAICDPPPSLQPSFLNSCKQV